jgi:hypothetical protein
MFFCKKTKIGQRIYELWHDSFPYNYELDYVDILSVAQNIFELLKENTFKYTLNGLGRN